MAHSKDKHKIVASHMRDYLDHTERSKRITAAMKAIKSWQRTGVGRGYTFDAIAYRGQSGAITASIIAHKLKKPLILVRKTEDNKGHSYFTVEGPTKISSYLIVDDFMSSGETFDAIVEGVAKHCGEGAVCMGMLEVNKPWDVPDQIEKGWEMTFSTKWHRAEQREQRWTTGLETEADIHHLVMVKQEKSVRARKAKEAREADQALSRAFMNPFKTIFEGVTKRYREYKAAEPQFIHTYRDGEWTTAFDFGPERKLLMAPPKEDKYQMFMYQPSTFKPRKEEDEQETVVPAELDPKDPASKIITSPPFSRNPYFGGGLASLLGPWLTQNSIRSK